MGERATERRRASKERPPSGRWGGASEERTTCSESGQRASGAARPQASCERRASARWQKFALERAIRSKKSFGTSLWLSLSPTPIRISVIFPHDKKPHHPYHRHGRDFFVFYIFLPLSNPYELLPILNGKYYEHSFGNKIFIS